MNDFDFSYEEMDLFSKRLANKIRVFYRNQSATEVEASVCTHGIVSQVARHATLDPKNFKFGVDPLSSTYLVFGESWVLRYLYRLGDFAKLPEISFSESLLRDYVDNVVPHYYDLNHWRQVAVANYWLCVLQDQYEHARVSVMRLADRKFVSKDKLDVLRTVRNCLAYLMSYIQIYLKELA